MVRLRDGGLVIFSAVALAEPDMAELERFGQPAFLVVPNDKHRLDARVWKARYPHIQVVAPRGAGGKVADVVPVDSTSPDFDDPDVQFVTLPGTGESEAALVVDSGGRKTLVLNDVIGNIRDAKGVGGWFLGVMGFAGTHPRIPGIVKRLLIKDKAALREQLLRWAKDQSVARILVSHGDVIDTNARDALMKLAESLA
ncbi:MAG TPA: hypothetical protein VGI70_21545 [Polyangiales bacterium]